MGAIRDIVRRVFYALPQDAALPILSGINRGKRWIVGAGLPRCLIGNYEAQELAIFAAMIGPSDVVWDIGAHAGYFTLASASRAKHVVAIEALPSNGANLRRHVQLNGLHNVTVVDRVICADPNGIVCFGGHESSYQGTIGRGDQSVCTATIDSLVAAGLAPPSIIKMDIEGAEADALRGAAATLRTARPTIMLALHGVDLRARCISILTGAGYSITDLNVGTILARHDTTG